MNGVPTVFIICAVTAIALPAQTLTTLVSFNGTNGANPVSELIQATDGNFYGTTSFGSPERSGTVFKITPSGALTTIYSFCSLTDCADGQSPFGALTEAPNGNFYGTTAGNENGIWGSVFELTPSGALSTLHTFSGNSDGADPFGRLLRTGN
jgi:uncharacterized repeat protein (TIGR03803 family)